MRFVGKAIGLAENLRKTPKQCIFPRIPTIQGRSANRDCPAKIAATTEEGGRGSGARRVAGSEAKAAAISALR
jgi:hypothetical protein